MSRQPIDQQQPLECRQAVWDEIRSQQAEFTINKIAKSVKLKKSTVVDYITGLHAAGYLLSTTPNIPGAQLMYVLHRDTGIDAPRVRKDGEAVTQGAGRQQMWNTMRILKSFSPSELAFNSSTEIHSVAASESKTYCQALSKAGYLVKRKEKYIFIASRWTGLKPPQIQRTKQIYDPNLKQVVWSKLLKGGAE